MIKTPNQGQGCGRELRRTIVEPKHNYPEWYILESSREREIKILQDFTKMKFV
jgi:hypothetical protein